MAPVRLPLICAPTPLHLLPRVSEDLAVEVWMKRDDLTGFALGGNKGRKLEYLLPEALAQGCNTIVTCGSLQSNFIRQLGAACSIAGIRCVAAVMALPVLSEDTRPSEPGLSDSGGNALLDDLLGVERRVYPDGTWDELFAHAEAVASELRSEGRKVYAIPVGGSSPLGAYAFYEAGLELLAQIEAPARFNHIVFASSSGSTHTGLQYAFSGTDTQVLGIACDPEPDLLDDFLPIYSGLEALTGEPRPVDRSQWHLNLDFVGPGYGVPSEAGNAAIRLLARREGIFLDPIYTGKAFAGLLEIARKRELNGRVLFWHTGGVPALFSAGLQGRGESRHLAFDRGG